MLPKCCCDARFAVGSAAQATIPPEFATIENHNLRMHFSYSRQVFHGEAVEFFRKRSAQ